MYIAYYRIVCYIRLRFSVNTKHARSVHGARLNIIICSKLYAGILTSKNHVSTIHHYWVIFFFLNPYTFVTYETMAPNASPFFNFNMDNHAIHIQKNVCHNFNYNNKTSTISLFRSRLKSIREQFVAVNSHYLRENVIESVSHYSPSTFVRKEKTENTWLNDMRSIK